jgi:hypothetical protein
MMNKIQLAKSILFTVLLAAGYLTLTPPAQTASITTIYTNPEVGSASLHENFTITIEIENVTNLNRWQIGITFNPSIINCTAVNIPQDNLFQNLSTINPSPVIDNEKGLVVKFLALDSAQGVNGSGILCNITFETLNPGGSHLNFTEKNNLLNGTYLQDPQDNFIDFESVNGTVNVIPLWPQNNFTATKNGIEYPVAIYSNSTISAFNFNETLEEIIFNVTGPDGTTGICLITFPKTLMDGKYFRILLNSNLIQSLTSQNGTYNFVFFKYPHSTQQIRVLPPGPGDINEDGKVDILDVAIASKAYGSYPGHPRWNPIADINDDDKVDIYDIAFIAKHFGEIYQN